MNCLLIINTKSGNSISASESDALIKYLKNKYTVTVRYIKTDDDDFSTEIKYADVLAVCGGDGTLNYAVNLADNYVDTILYFPCGTINDLYKTARYHCKKSHNNTLFYYPISFNENKISYVFAGGTFCPIAWAPKDKTKKTFKRLSYLFYVLREYKVHNMVARININGNVVSDVYTLIMVVKSRATFGFSFNRLYSPDKKSAHVLLIKSPVGSLKGLKLFISFFRAFFIGFDKEYAGKSITFKEFKTLSFELDNPIPFCLDGEKKDGVTKALITIADRPINIVFEKYKN